MRTQHYFCAPPKQDLPLELVQEIFRHTHSCDADNRDTFQALLGTCEQWRRCALGVSAFFHHVTRRGRASNVDWMQRRIEVARNTPLHLHVVIEDYEDEEDLGPFISLVSTHAPRWQHIRIDCTDFYLAKAVLDFSRHNAMPLLQSVSIIDNPPFLTPIEPCLLLAHAPLFRSISVASGHLEHFSPLRSLTDLHLNFCYVTMSLLKTLSEHPVERLYLGRGIWQGITWRGRVPLKCLHELTIQGIPWEQLQSLLDAIDAPWLSSLAVLLYRTPDDTYISIERSLAQRCSFPRVVDLTVTIPHQPASTSFLSAVLYSFGWACPNVVTFSTNIPAAFYDALHTRGSDLASLSYLSEHGFSDGATSELDIPSVAFPLLRHLRCADSGVSLCSVVLDLIASFAEANSIPLDTITVDTSDFFSPAPEMCCDWEEELVPAETPTSLLQRAWIIEAFPASKKAPLWKAPLRKVAPWPVSVWKARSLKDPRGSSRTCMARCSLELDASRNADQLLSTLALLSLDREPGRAPFARDLDADIWIMILESTHDCATNTPDPRILRLVCKAFDRLVRQTSLLWHHIYRSAVYCNYDAMEQRLQFSGGRPLHLCLEVAQNDDLSEFVTWFRRRQTQWQTIDIHTSELSLLANLFSGAHLPALESLSFFPGGDDRGDDPSLGIRLDPIGMRRLRRLRLHIAQLALAGADSIVRLHLEFRLSAGGVPDPLDAAFAYPRLTHLLLSGVTSDNALPATRTTLHSLDVFILLNVHAGAVRPLLAVLRAPRLHTLAVILRTNTTFESGQIADHSGALDSFPSLELLHVNQGGKQQHNSVPATMLISLGCAFQEVTMLQTNIRWSTVASILDPKPWPVPPFPRIHTLALRSRSAGAISALKRSLEWRMNTPHPISRCGVESHLISVVLVPQGVRVVQWNRDLDANGEPLLPLFGSHM
ncbi:hypothetical protein HWV62_35935 [Athelia sp. TMB]|nr:hypothetical protein HWV62_35935 [Athelia sp. TMB]